MDEERAIVEETALLEPGERRRAVGDLGGLEIDRVLGEVDVTTDIGRAPHGRLVQGLV